jgi:hypothetical protein
MIDRGSTHAEALTRGAIAPSEGFLIDVVEAEKHLAQIAMTIMENLVNDCFGNEDGGKPLCSAFLCGLSKEKTNQLGSQPPVGAEFNKYWQEVVLMASY